MVIVVKTTKSTTVSKCFDHELIFLDSLQSRGFDVTEPNQYQLLVEKYMEAEYKHKLGVYRMKGVSRNYSYRCGLTKKLQQNDCDCGVFVCSMVYSVCHYIPVDTFTQKHMSFFRKHMIISLSQDSLMNLITCTHFNMEGK